MTAALAPAGYHCSDAAPGRGGEAGPGGRRVLQHLASPAAEREQQSHGCSLHGLLSVDVEHARAAPQRRQLPATRWMHSPGGAGPARAWQERAPLAAVKVSIHV